MFCVNRCERIKNCFVILYSSKLYLYTGKTRWICDVRSLCFLLHVVDCVGQWLSSIVFQGHYFHGPFLYSPFLRTV